MNVSWTVRHVRLYTMHSHHISGAKFILVMLREIKVARDQLQVMLIDKILQIPTAAFMWCMQLGHVTRLLVNEKNIAMVTRVLRWRWAHVLDHLLPLLDVVAVHIHDHPVQPTAEFRVGT